MPYNKYYRYLDISEKEILNSLKVIQKLCNVIKSKKYLNCDDCPFGYWCNNGDICSIHINNDKEFDILVNSLVKLDKKIKNDIMTF